MLHVEASAHSPVVVTTLPLGHAHRPTVWPSGSRNKSGSGCSHVASCEYRDEGCHTLPAGQLGGAIGGCGGGLGEGGGAGDR